MIEKFRQEEDKNHVWLATRFDKFNFHDSKPLRVQLHEYINVRAQLVEEGMMLFDRLFIALIPSNLPTSSSTFVYDNRKNLEEVDLIHSIWLEDDISSKQGSLQPTCHPSASK